MRAHLGPGSPVRKGGEEVTVWAGARPGLIPHTLPGYMSTQFQSSGWRLNSR